MNHKFRPELWPTQIKSKLKSWKYRLIAYIKRLLFPIYLFPLKLVTYSTYYLAIQVLRQLFQNCLLGNNFYLLCLYRIPVFIASRALWRLRQVFLFRVGGQPDFETVGSPGGRRPVRRLRLFCI